MLGCVKSMVMPAAVVTALFKLKSRLRPTLVLLEMVMGEAKVMVWRGGVPEFREQTEFAGQEPIAELLVLEKTVFTTPS